MSPIKDLNLIYEAVNPQDTFSAGDTVIGTVTFNLTKETKVKSLIVKLKGDANVHWTEGSGDDESSYSANKRYFKHKEYLVGEHSRGTVLPQGDHCFAFELKFPQGDFPSSFKGEYGKIVYILEAKMSRSWRMPSNVQKELKYVSKCFSLPGQVACPQSGSVNKDVGVFSKERVQMSATVDKNICSPGDTLSFVAKISNSSSKTMRAKFNLLQTTVYRASGSTTSSEKSLCKMVGDNIPVNSEETVSCQLKVPVDAIYTLHNCEILSVDYCVKVYLDISFATDPEVIFPLNIVPSGFANLHPGQAMGPYPAGAVGAPSYSDFPPPAFPTGPYPMPAGPGAYGYPAPNPTQQLNPTSGYNQWPQQPAPYGYPNAAFPPVPYQAPTAPPMFQQGEHK
ncbi:arrestin domain-containing protein 3-like [Morone saxatilis]|uniref:arrestin domain-containing protein 3-like n=1 Tax=Morone saxatilis TaxID=34816 RepID=UPI0015E1BE77|nr:arrestin domain-containing protein 3-like [Morone saxatilis]